MLYEIESCTAPPPSNLLDMGPRDISSRSIYRSEALTVLCLFFVYLFPLESNCTVFKNCVILYGSVSYNQFLVDAIRFHINSIAYCVVMRDLPRAFLQSTTEKGLNYMYLSNTAWPRVAIVVQ